MGSIVIDLQQEITSSECDVVQILRRAHIIAFKLGLKEFDEWIKYELSGYPNLEVCPEYRKIRGVLKAFNPYQGWIPTMITDRELENKICERKITNSISEIMKLCESSENGLVSEFTGEQLDLFNRLFDSPLPMRYALHIPGSAASDIVEKVKNTILEWTLKLEFEGILGENMRFSMEEKETAKTIPQTVYNYYGATNVINAECDGMQIVSGNEKVSFSYEKVGEVLSEIEEAVSRDQIKEEDKDTAIELLSEIRDTIRKEKKPQVLKALFVGLKDFLINAGGSLAAGLIQAKMQGLF